MSNAKEVIKNWKKNKGFPYYPTDKKWKDKEYQNLLSFNRDTILDVKNQIIGQSTHGLSLAWSYMPHAWSVKCGKMKTPMEIWEDEEHLEKGINKILTGTFFKQKSADNITDSDMRAMLRRYSGTQMVSNFRPTAAATLYDIFVDKDSPLEGTEAGTVWDPSMGYGGRLMGAIAAGVNYIGTDPCVPTYQGLEKIRDEYGHSHKKYTLLRQGSETYIPEENSLDFVFTSPPYLGHEQYGDEEEQSFKKFPIQDQWRNGFLLQTIKNAYRGLKPGKFAGLYDTYYKLHPELSYFTYDCMVRAGFKDIDIWWLSLSTQQGTKTQSTLEGESVEAKQKNNYIGRFARPDIPGRKYEPIFIGIK